MNIKRLLLKIKQNQAKSGARFYRGRRTDLKVCPYETSIDLSRFCKFLPSLLMDELSRKRRSFSERMNRMGKIFIHPIYYCKSCQEVTPDSTLEFYLSCPIKRNFQRIGEA